MRTVHETEALRPSDPVPKSMQSGTLGAGGKAGKLKIIIKTPQSHAAGHDDSVDDGSNAEDHVHEDFFTQMSADQGFTSEELGMPLERLYRLCRAQVRWAEAEGEELQRECRQWEELYRDEALQKNALVSQIIQSEMDWHERRQAILSGAADVQILKAGGGSQAGGASAAEAEHANGSVAPEEGRNGADAAPRVNGGQPVASTEAMEE